MADISPFTPHREKKQRKEASTEKSSGNDEVVLIEEGMTDPMHPKHNEARKAVERAEDAFIGSPDQINDLATKVAEKGLQDDLTIVGGQQTAEKAGLAPEMDQEGSIIQDAIEEDEKAQKDQTWDDSPFSRGADL